MKTEITIAAAATMSGAASVYGLQIASAVRHVVERINSTGGLLGQSLRFSVHDDEGSGELARAHAQDIVSAGASLVVGHYLSSCSLAAAPTYASAGIIQIAPSTTTPSFTDIAWAAGSRTTFRTCGRDDKQGRVAAEYIARHHPGARVAILHNDSPYGKGLAEIVQRNLRGLGVSETLSASVTASPHQVHEVIERLREVKADFVYIGGYYAEVAAFLVAAAASQYEPMVMTGGASANKALYALAGEHSNGLLMTCRPDARELPEARDAVIALRSYNVEPEGYTLAAVAAVEIWSQAVEACGTLDSRTVAQEMHARQFPTSYGDIAFDEKGDVVSPLYAIHKWTNGKYLPLTA